MESMRSPSAALLQPELVHRSVSEAGSVASSTRSRLSYLAKEFGMLSINSPPSTSNSGLESLSISQVESPAAGTPVSNGSARSMAERVKQYVSAFTPPGQAPASGGIVSPGSSLPPSHSSKSPEIVATPGAPFVTRRRDPQTQAGLPFDTPLSREPLISPATTEGDRSSSLGGQYKELPPLFNPARPLELEQIKTDLLARRRNAKLHEEMAIRELEKYRELVARKSSQSPTSSSSSNSSSPNRIVPPRPSNNRPKKDIGKDDEDSEAQNLSEPPSNDEGADSRGRTGDWLDEQQILKELADSYLPGDTHLSDQPDSSVPARQGAYGSAEDYLVGNYELPGYTESPPPSYGDGKLQGLPDPSSLGQTAAEMDAFTDRLRRDQEAAERAMAYGDCNGGQPIVGDELLQQNDWLIRQVRKSRDEKLALKGKLADMAQARHEQSNFLEQIGAAVRQLRAPPAGNIIIQPKNSDREQALHTYKANTDWDVYVRDFLERAVFNKWDEGTMSSKLRFSLDPKAMEIAVHADPSVVDEFHFATLLTKLKAIFGKAYKEGDAKSQFLGRTQQVGESYQEYMLILQCLYNLAWPGEPVSSKDSKLVDKFVHSILDYKMAEYLWDRDCLTPRCRSSSRRTETLWPGWT